jgi:hypothetical protein
MKCNLLISKWPLKYLLLAAVAIKILGVFFATLIFAKFTPLIDSNLYLQNGMNLDPFLRTRIINSTAVFLNSIGGVYFAHFVFSLFSISGLLYYYLTGGRRWVLLLFLLLPSSLVWSSIVGKEAVFYGATGVVIVIWSKYAVRKMASYDFLFLIVALLVCALQRPHYALAYVWLFFSAYTLARFEKSAFKILLVAFLLFAIFFYFIGWESLALRGFGGIDPFARSSRFDLLGINPFTGEGYLKFKAMILNGMIWGVIGPFPSELLSRPEFTPFFIEGLFIFLIPVLATILVILIKIENKRYFYKIFFISLAPAILILLFMHAPFGILNPGSAIRWRVNFEQVFYLAPMLLIFRFMDVKTQENPSLSP